MAPADRWRDTGERRKDGSPSADRDRDAQVFDRLSIRTKLIAIVVAPLAVIMVFAGLGFTQRRSESAGTRADVARLESIDAAQALQHELQLETLHSVNFLTGEGEELP